MCDDSDQACGPTKVCQIFSCQQWIDGEQVKPPLVKSAPHGFWVCDKCGSSYGVDPFPGAGDSSIAFGTKSTDLGETK